MNASAVLLIVRAAVEKHVSTTRITLKDFIHALGGSSIALVERLRVCYCVYMYIDVLDWRESAF